MASSDAPLTGRPGEGTSGHGGFLQLPAGTFAADPRSQGSYLLGAARWLPVPRAWVSPDGSHYAYPEYRPAPGPAGGLIHVVEVTGGADRAITVPAPSLPVSYEAAGIFIASVRPNTDAPPHGLSLLDPATGSLRQVAAEGIWTAVGQDLAWGADLDDSIGAPPNPGPGAANRVRRLDLKTGAVSVLERRPGVNVQVLGAAPQGTVPILAETDASGYRVMIGERVLFQGPAGTGNPGGPVVVDGGAIWFSSPSGAVWRAASASAQAGRVAATVTGGMVAGACR